MIIREAELKDLEQALVVGWEMHQESRYRNMEFNLDKVAQFFTFIIESSDYLFLIVEKNSQVVGGFIGYAMPTWFSDELAAGDFALYIYPEHRGGTAALRMVKQYLAWCESKGVPPDNIDLGITTGVHTEKTKAFYEKLGFEMTGLVMNYRGKA